MMAHRPRISPKRCLGYKAVQVWAFIDRCLDENGSAPSYDEIRAANNIKTRGEVSRIVDSLERRGFISRVGAGRVRRIGRAQTANLHSEILVINGCPK